MGRGTRLPEGVFNLNDAKAAGIDLKKTDCLVIDMVDVTSQHSLITLPSLFGLNEKADFKGKSVTEIMAAVDAAKKINPLMNPALAEDLDNVKAYAEQVDLFANAIPPEIVQLSEYRWFRCEDAR